MIKLFNPDMVFFTYNDISKEVKEELKNHLPSIGYLFIDIANHNSSFIRQQLEKEEVIKNVTSFAKNLTLNELESFVHFIKQDEMVIKILSKHDFFQEIIEKKKEEEEKRKQKDLNEFQLTISLAQMPRIIPNDIRAEKGKNLFFIEDHYVFEKKVEEDYETSFTDLLHYFLLLKETNAINLYKEHKYYFYRVFDAIPKEALEFFALHLFFEESPIIKYQNEQPIGRFIHLQTWNSYPGKRKFQEKCSNEFEKKLFDCYLMKETL